MATGGKLSFAFSIDNVTANIQDVMVNPSRSQVALRTKDSLAPVKVYNLSGEKEGQFGKGLPGLSQAGRMSLDSERGLYLASCLNHLLTINMDGKLVDKIPIPGGNNVGVTYIKETDQYVVSDAKKHVISLVDPREKKIVGTITGSKPGTGSFSGALFLNTCNDPMGNPLILLSDTGNHCVHLLEPDGTAFRVYGTQGAGDAQLNKPMGVVVEDMGRIIVCDQGNKRVTSFWTEDDVDGWACLLDQEELKGEPSWMDFDPQHNILALKAGNSVKVYTYES